MKLSCGHQREFTSWFCIKLHDIIILLSDGIIIQLDGKVFPFVKCCLN